MHNIQTERQTDNQTYIQKKTDRQRKTNRHTDRKKQTDRHTNIQTYIQKNNETDRQKNKQTQRQKNKQTYTQKKDRQTEKDKQTYRQKKNRQTDIYYQSSLSTEKLPQREGGRVGRGHHTHNTETYCPPQPLPLQHPTHLRPQWGVAQPPHHLPFPRPSTSITPENIDNI